ncbi:prepilin-type N-terminal cleavage/methylation domain-containing protein [Niveispirillum sp. KHB5.9]|uniref:prepilin-type N-terminal cleavage/methylation domain-containing protein n=1 Tax=Niveispirillum sp. KHB5.9 TaxID=3400269 RepID=UPI003A85C3B0
MRKRQAGFTLLEAMVALAVLGLVLTVAAMAMGTLGKARARVTDAADRAGQLSLVRDVLRRQVSRALLLMVEDGLGVRYVLTAKADRLSFPLADPPLPGRGGLAIADIRADGGRLLYAQSREGHPRYETVLAEGDFSFRLSYRGDDPRQGWVSDWTDNVRWPRLVRLEVIAGGRVMPAIVLPVRADADRGCVLALGEGFCRDRQG